MERLERVRQEKAAREAAAQRRRDEQRQREERMTRYFTSILRCKHTRSKFLRVLDEQRLELERHELELHSAALKIQKYIRGAAWRRTYLCVRRRVRAKNHQTKLFA